MTKNERIKMLEQRVETLEAMLKLMQQSQQAPTIIPYYPVPSVVPPQPYITWTCDGTDARSGYSS